MKLIIMSVLASLLLSPLAAHEEIGYSPDQSNQVEDALLIMDWMNSRSQVAVPYGPIVQQWYPNTYVPFPVMPDRNPAKQAAAKQWLLEHGTREAGPGVYTNT